jgi:hypothetical protein
MYGRKKDDISIPGEPFSVPCNEKKYVHIRMISNLLLAVLALVLAAVLGFVYWARKKYPGGATNWSSMWMKYNYNRAPRGFVAEKDCKCLDGYVYDQARGDKSIDRNGVRKYCIKVTTKNADGTPYSWNERYCGQNYES